ncbi:MAG: deoxyhypusine synthase [Nitrososphaerota archaeon]|nr:deoxyhypusine synthase [Nitrososphaerota archaeon]
MARNKRPFRPVEDFEVGDEGVGAVAAKMARSGGFAGRHFGEAVGVLKDMWDERECYRILSFTADVVSTGLRGVIKQLVRDRKFDMLVTTCGTLDHDLARCFAPYYEGDFSLDDRRLLREGYHRLGNVVIPKGSYGPVLEKFLQPMLEELHAGGLRSASACELAWEAGRRTGDEGSILYWAEKNRIPVMVPGITDGAFGSQVWLFHQRRRDFQLDLMKDEQMMSDAVFDAKRLGAVMLGGGISKHHTIWWAQFRGGLDYAAYVTTAVEYDGSLSGALLKEAISWGKVKPRAKQVTVHGDVTALFPFLVAAALSGHARVPNSHL